MIDLRGSRILLALAGVLASTACVRPGDTETPLADESAPVDIDQRLAQYAIVRLETDLGHLSEPERQIVRLLIEAVEPMDSVYWQEAYGDKAALRASVPDPRTWRYVEINYGPWDRLAGNEPFLPGVGAQPAGASV